MIIGICLFVSIIAFAFIAVMIGKHSGISTWDDYFGSTKPKIRLIAWYGLIRSKPKNITVKVI